MLALIAGQGDLPTHVVKHLSKWPVIAALDGFAPDELLPEITFRLENLGTFLQQLRDKGVTEICFAGAIRRPQLDPSQLDAATMPLVPKMMQALGQGDDAALRIVIEIFQEAGFSVVGVDQLAANLFPNAGCPTKIKPQQSDYDDVDRGRDILAAMSVVDVGQACVIAGGQAKAIEAIGGTDWMLESIQPSDGRTKLPQGGVLVKAAKQGQDRRADLPTIGTETIKNCAAAGLSGLAIPRGDVIVLNYEAVIKAADEYGLFVWIWEQNQ